MEEWRPVVGWEGLYEVSSYARVKSLHFGKERILKPRPGHRGYEMYRLQFKGRERSVSAHRLVAEAFIPNPEGHPMVLHWDDDPSNNRVENLRWGTASDNGKDAVRNGNHPTASRTHCPRGHKYSEENTYINKTSGSRICRNCRRDDARDKYHREKETA